MFYIDFPDQLNFLITVCFSFSIFVFSIWFRNSGGFPRLFGISFLIPSLLVIASFLARKKSVSASLLELAIPALLLALFVLHLIKPARKHLGTTAFFSSAFSLLIIYLVIKIPYMQNYSSIPANILVPVVILLVLNMFFLKKEEGPKSYLFWALLPLSAASALGCYVNKGLILYLVPLLKIIAFLLFTLYFYNEYYKNMVQKAEEAEKRITRINRSLDMEVKKRMLEIERINQNLVNISKIDSLSKALNKRAILDAIDNLINAKAKGEFSIFMFDIDNFKTINDTLGHVTGDKCIKALANNAKGNMREFDLIGRYGGDEFIIVLPGANTQQTINIAERFRKKVESSEQPHYTISIGVASYPKDGTTVKELLEIADDGLYKSKEKGRNSVSYKEVY